MKRKAKVLIAIGLSLIATSLILAFTIHIPNSVLIPCLAAGFILGFGGMIENV